MAMASAAGTVGAVQSSGEAKSAARGDREPIGAGDGAARGAGVSAATTEFPGSRGARFGLGAERLSLVEFDATTTGAGCLAAVAAGGAAVGAAGCGGLALAVRIGAVSPLVTALTMR